MARKFMKTKSIVLSILTIAIITSQLTGCATISQDNLIAEANESPEIVIEVPEFDDSTQKTEVETDADDIVNQTYEEVQEIESKKEIEYLTKEDKEWVFQETYDNTQQMVKGQGGSDSQSFEIELTDLPSYLDYYKELFDGRVSPGIDTLREEYKTWRIEKYGDGTSSKSEVSKPSETTQQQKPAANQTQQKPSQSQQKPSSNQTNGQSNGNTNSSESSSLGPLGSSGASDGSINIIGENRTQEQIEKDIQAMKEASEKAYEAGIKFN